MSTIVMTGGSSGFGALAAEHLVRSDDVRLLVGARGAVPYGEALPLDLARLRSAEQFAAAVDERVGSRGIDALVLNAGIVRPDADGRTADGFETTFAVNHLAHFVVLRQLLPHLAAGAVVVLTTSGTHDPSTGAGLAVPRHADAELLAHPDRDPGTDSRSRKAGQHAYTASKLCAILTVRAVATMSEAREKGVTAVAYCPGQVFGTGLARSLPAPMRVAWSVLGGAVLGPPLRALNATHNTPEKAGRTLAELALGRTAPPDGRAYAALRRGRLTWPDPSERARDAAQAQALWRDSADLVGLAT